MHVCPANFAMAGFHKAQNDLYCARTKTDHTDSYPSSRRPHLLAFVRPAIVAISLTKHQEFRLQTRTRSQM